MASISSGASSPAPDDVGFIMEQCSCSRRKAASALKLHKGDRSAAIRSLQESIHLTSPLGGAAPCSRPRSPALSKPKTANHSVSDIASPAPHSYYQLPEPEKLLSTPKSSSPVSRKQSPSRDGPTPPPLRDVESSIPLRAKELISSENTNNSGLTPIGKPAGQPPDSGLGSLVNGFPAAIERWDFRLPSINIPIGEPPFSPDEGRRLPFSLARLLATLSRGMSPAQLQHYLLFFDESVVQSGIKASICGIPSVFYAVATNDENIVRTWAAHGADMNIREPKTAIPVLAFAIMRTRAANEDTTSMVMTLLSLGADPTVIPRSLFTPCLDDPVEQHAQTGFAEPKVSWCSEAVYATAAKTINLSQRYFLEKVLKSQAPTSRQSQVTRIHNATALLGVSHFLIGQTAATQLVSDVLISHLALPRTKPLVMAFTGPSGHGKTELAKRMGELLNLEICCVDCTEMKHETDLFGPKMPYLGYELGSPLNNFLTRNTGKRCIVFLDELEKTTSEVQNSLLVPFSEGRYSDRRNREAVDTSQTIWIFATNAADDVILDFFQVHEHYLSATDDPMRRNKLILDLTMAIKKQLKSTFGNPLSGRISVIVPFLPFSPVEAAVVAHKFVLEFKRRVLQSIRVEGKQLVGHVALDMLLDGKLCRLIAEEGYDCDQGARSLQTSVETRIGDAMVRAYLEEESQIDDTLPLTKYVVSVARNGNIIVRRADPAMHGKQEELYSAEQLQLEEVTAASVALGGAPSIIVQCEQEEQDKSEMPVRKKETDVMKPVERKTRPKSTLLSKSWSPRQVSKVKEDPEHESIETHASQDARKRYVSSDNGEGSGSEADVEEIPRNNDDEAKEDRIKRIAEIFREYPSELTEKSILASKEWKKKQAETFPNLFKNLETASAEESKPPHDLMKGMNDVMANFMGGNKQMMAQTEFLMSALEGGSFPEAHQKGIDDLRRGMNSWRRNMKFAEQESSSLMDVLGLAEEMLWGPAAENAMNLNSQTPEEKARTLEGLRESLAGIMPKLLGEDSSFFKDMDHVGMRGVGMLRKQLQSFVGGQIMFDPRNMPSGPPPLTEYDAFHYDTLGSTPSIRLLYFEDEIEDNPCFIKLRIEEVELSSNPVFNALSYVWGDHRPPLFQRFNSKRSQWRFALLCNGKRIEITYNLFCCLRRISTAKKGPLSNFRAMPLWIDQLCINQSDNAEKGEQVALMDQIYAAAQSVVSWLGETGSLAAGAMSFIDELNQVPMDWIKSPDFDPTTFVTQFSSDDWLSLGSILARPYFKRVWIVQEIALAKKLLLVCGDELLEWKKLIDALAVVNASRAWQELSEYVLLFRPPEEQLPSLGVRSALRFGDELSILVEAQEAARGDGLTPANLLFFGRRFDATQVVDKFYAMVGMAKHGASTPAEAAQLPPVDYSLNLKDVALNFARYYMIHLDGTAFLSLVEDAKYKTDASQDFPSWLPDPAAPLLPVPLKAQGLKFDAATSWRACGDLLATKALRINQDSLLLRGFKSEFVWKTAMPFNLIDSTKEWYQLFDFIRANCENLNTNGFSVGQAFWRTLTTSFDRANPKSAATADMDENFTNWCVSLIVAIERRHIHTLGGSASADFMAVMHRAEDMQFDIQVFGNAIKTYLEQDLASEMMSSYDLHHHVVNTKLGEPNSEAWDDDTRPDRLLKASLEQLWAQTGQDDVFPSPTDIYNVLDQMHETRRGTEVYKTIFDSVGKFETALRKNIHSRTLFITSDGRLSMGPHSVADGDEVWILPGASVPFIFRPVSRGNYTLVGEAFVFGVMHGEAVPDASTVVLEEIEIR